jgi:hypothetical protein
MSSSVGFNNHFHWINTRSAWQDIEYHRQLRAQSIQQDQDTTDAANSAMFNAQQNKISAAATNAAQAALTRIKAAAKAKNDAVTAQIDSAQSVLTQAQKATASATSTTTSSTPATTLLNTVA